MAYRRLLLTLYRPCLFTSDDGLSFSTTDLRGTDGVDGTGFTGASYDPATGQVTFTSNDGLGFTTGDLRGADGNDGNDGTGFTGGSYNASTGRITFTSDDGLGFTTGDVRGTDGNDGMRWNWDLPVAATTHPPVRSLLLQTMGLASPPLICAVLMVMMDQPI